MDREILLLAMIKAGIKNAGYWCSCNFKNNDEWKDDLLFIREALIGEAWEKKNGI